MKQTAVEWLQFEINRRGPKENNPPQWLKELYEQAKQMEKEQMCDFVEYCEIEHSKYQETEASWIKELTIDDLFEKRYTNKQ
jgi:hypothetical protein